MKHERDVNERIFGSYTEKKNRQVTGKLWDIKEVILSLSLVNFRADSSDPVEKKAITAATQRENTRKTTDNGMQITSTAILLREE